MFITILLARYDSIYPPLIPSFVTCHHSFILPGCSNSIRIITVTRISEIVVAVASLATKLMRVSADT